MSQLLVNKLNILDEDTRKSIESGSAIFERKEDRSIMIAGVFAITLDSVAPVSKKNSLKFRRQRKTIIKLTHYQT